MPYRQYVVHFRPTARCVSCGRPVCCSWYYAAVSVAVLGVAAVALFIAWTETAGLRITAVALLVLLSLLGDLWTYRNLSWDPLEKTDTR